MAAQLLYHVCVHVHVHNVHVHVHNVRVHVVLQCMCTCTQSSCTCTRLSIMGFFDCNNTIKYSLNGTFCAGGILLIQKAQ